MKRLESLYPARGVLLVALVLAVSVFTAGGTANAAPTPVGLGTATDFAIRADDTITNGSAGTSITGDVGLRAPGAGITGLVCANITDGTMFSTDGAGPAPCSGTDPGTTVANDARAAFNNASALPGATPTVVTDLSLANGGTGTLVAGLYSFGGAPTNLTTTLALDAQGSADAVWIFQASSTLITSSASTVSFINLPASDPTGALLACNVFWTVGSSATLGSGSTFVGTILASVSIAVNDDATVVGRLLAANQGGGGGAVTIPDEATITRPTGCATLPAGTGGGPATPPAAPTPVVATPNTTG